MRWWQIRARAPAVLPEFESLTAKEGSAAAVAIGAALLAFKRWLKGRSELRQDGAEASMADTYRAIIKDQEDHIARLDTRLKDANARADRLEDRIIELSQRVTDELNRRYIAENAARNSASEAGGLRAQVADLERKVAELQAARPVDK